MLLPVDRWIVTNTEFLLTLVLYLYALYFTYRRTKPFSLFTRRKYFTIIVLMLVLILVTELLTYFPMQGDGVMQDPRQLEVKRNMRTQTIWFLFLVVTCFSLVIELTFELFRQTLLRQELAAGKDRAELALYKAQINPHFLFNTLNALYALTLSKSDQAESAFVKFSNILRYMYEQTERDFITIAEELEYLRQYVDLQKLRLNHHTKVYVVEEIEDGNASVPPMLFITFVENSFKYGSSPETDCTIRIEIKLQGGLLFFHTENAVMRHFGNRPHGIGIENCRKRLQLLYPERFKLEIHENDGIYSVRLMIHLKDDSQKS